MDGTGHSAQFAARRIHSILPIIICLAAFQGIANAQRSIPDDNLAYPVLVSLGDGSSGSGFFLNTPDGVYLVTAKHVLFNEQTQSPRSPVLQLLSYSKDPADATKIRIAVALPVLQQSGRLKTHPSADIAVLRLFQAQSDSPPQSQTPQPNASPASATTATSQNARKISPLPGVVVESMAESGILGVDAANGVKKFDQVLTGNDVILFGYPSSLALQQLRQLDPNRPLLRKGIVAGKNPDTKSIILDCPVYFGNSGGPVLEMDHQGFADRLYIIGVVDQYVPFVQTAGTQTLAMQIASNSGYSIIIPMDYVMELIK